MTKEERKIFLELPADGRDDFVEEFWKRRDPDPDTALNEYRLEYEQRVERAGQLFHGEGRSGWQTDRGRIYILFGPPSERQTYPMDAGGYCREVWYYGSLPSHLHRRALLGQLRPAGHQPGAPPGAQYRPGPLPEDVRPGQEALRLRSEHAEGPGRGGRVRGQGLRRHPLQHDLVRLQERPAGDGLRRPAGDLGRGGHGRRWDAEGSFPLSLEEQDAHGEPQGPVPHGVHRSCSTRTSTGWRTKKLRMDVTVKSAAEGEELKKAVEFRLKS
ncbi:MAG: GWxTD domain-containing protein [Marinilabiliales bacterium]|nr:GWxTD domain-containing protein [Marinilabiliales bacterium]